MVHGRVANEVKSIYVEVVNRSTVPVCHEEWMFGIQWPETAPNLDAMQDCPLHYVGTVKRRCNLRNSYFTQWDLPDFSSCISEAVESIHNNVSHLTVLPVWTEWKE
jgi:Hormone receptor domain.